MKKQLGVFVATVLMQHIACAETANITTNATNQGDHTTPSQTQPADNSKKEHNGSLYDAFKSGWNKMIDTLAPPDSQ